MWESPADDVLLFSFVGDAGVFETGTRLLVIDGRATEAWVVHVLQLRDRDHVAILCHLVLAFLSTCVGGAGLFLFLLDNLIVGLVATL